MGNIQPSKSDLEAFQQPNKHKRSQSEAGRTSYQQKYRINKNLSNMKSQSPSKKFQVIQYSQQRSQIFSKQNLNDTTYIQSEKGLSFEQKFDQMQKSSQQIQKSSKIFEQNVVKKLDFSEITQQESLFDTILQKKDKSLSDQQSIITQKNQFINDKDGLIQSGLYEYDANKQNLTPSKDLDQTKLYKEKVKQHQKNSNDKSQMQEQITNLEQQVQLLLEQLNSKQNINKELDDPDIVLSQPMKNYNSFKNYQNDLIQNSKAHNIDINKQVLNNDKKIKQQNDIPEQQKEIIKISAQKQINNEEQQNSNTISVESVKEESQQSIKIDDFESIQSGKIEDYQQQFNESMSCNTIQSHQKSKELQQLQKTFAQIQQESIKQQNDQMINLPYQISSNDSLMIKTFKKQDTQQDEQDSETKITQKQEQNILNNLPRFQKMQQNQQDNFNQKYSPLQPQQNQQDSHQNLNNSPPTIIQNLQDSQQFKQSQCSRVSQQQPQNKTNFSKNTQERYDQISSYLQSLQSIPNQNSSFSKEMILNIEDLMQKNFDSIKVMAPSDKNKPNLKKSQQIIQEKNISSSKDSSQNEIENFIFKSMEFNTKSQTNDFNSNFWVRESKAMQFTPQRTTYKQNQSNMNYDSKMSIVQNSIKNNQNIILGEQDLNSQYSLQNNQQKSLNQSDQTCSKSKAFINKQVNDLMSEIIARKFENKF